MWDDAPTLHDQVALGSIPDYRYDIGLQAKSDKQWFSALPSIRQTHD